MTIHGVFLFTIIEPPTTVSTSYHANGISSTSQQQTQPPSTITDSPNSSIVRDTSPYSPTVAHSRSMTSDTPTMSQQHTHPNISETGSSDDPLSLTTTTMNGKTSLVTQTTPTNGSTTTPMVETTPIDGSLTTPVVETTSTDDLSSTDSTAAILSNISLIASKYIEFERKVRNYLNSQVYKDLV